MTDAKLTVVIVDDHSIFRSGLRADLDDSLEVLGEAATVDEAVEAIERLQPDVVLLDVHLPGGKGGGGAEVLRTAQLGRTKALALSVSDSAEDVVGVIRAGARGYITKGSSGPQVSRAVATKRSSLSRADAVISLRNGITGASIRMASSCIATLLFCFAWDRVFRLAAGRDRVGSGSSAARRRSRSIGPCCR